MWSKIGIPAAAVVFVALAAGVAQDSRRDEGPPAARQEGEQRDRGDRGGDRRNWDPAQFRQRMMDGLKEQLKASDEEWAVLQPKVDAVMTAQREARGSMMGRGGAMGWGNRDRNRDGEARAEEPPANELETASRELRTALQDENAAGADIAAKLTAYREARTKAAAKLTTARAELKELLTPRQEAVLVMSGLLE
mgnify:CR=1 FL=1